MQARIPRRHFLYLAGTASAAAFLPWSRAGLVSAQTGLAERLVSQDLANGLTVVVVERRTAGTVAVQLTARDGARNDPDLPGISVITSRMMFQGTPRRPSETALQRAAAAVGGSVSRGTSTELSSISSVVSSRDAEVAFDLVGDIVTNPLLDPEALQRQQQVAFQEIAQRRANPNQYIDELFTSNIYSGHPAAIPVLGSPESIAAIDVEAVVGRRANHWRAANLVLTVTGEITAEDAIKAAERYLSGIPAGPAVVDVPSTPDLATAPRTVTGSAGQQQAVFRIGYVGPGLLEPDRYPMTVMNSIMTGTSGRLYTELRSRRGLAYVAGSGYLGLSDTGAWFATAGVDPQNLEAAIDIVRAEIEQMRSEPPDPAEVARRQSEIAGRQILADETNSARANRLASRILLGTEPTEEFVRRIRAVTPADVLRVAQTYLNPDAELLVVVGPERGGPGDQQ